MKIVAECRWVCLLIIVLIGGMFLVGCGGNEPTLVLKVLPVDSVVSVDNYVHPGKSPHIIEFKSLGRYQLSISREGFDSVNMIVTMENGERREQIVELVRANSQIAVSPIPPDSGLQVNVNPLPQNPVEIAKNDLAKNYTASISSSPPGAEVTLSTPGSIKSHNYGKTPLTVELPKNKSTMVVLAMPGYNSHKRLLVEPANGGQVNYHATLTRKNSLPANNNLNPIDFGQPPIQKNDFGYLSIVTTPWSVVHIDGKPMGNTPLANKKIEVGTHKILLENRDLGKRTTKTVVIHAGEHVRIVENL